MKTAMSTIKVTLILTVLTVQMIFAGNKNQQALEQGLKNYIVALQSGNTGMMESAMVNLMHLRAVSPEADYKKALESLEKISLDAENPVLRYKAYITASYLKNPEWFNEYPPLRGWIAEDKDLDEVFEKIGEKLPADGGQVAQN